MPSTSRLVAALLSSTLLLASADVRAQSPTPSPEAQPSAPPPAAPPQTPPPYVTPAPQQGYPAQGYPSKGIRQAHPQQAIRSSPIRRPATRSPLPAARYPQQGLHGVRASAPAGEQGLMITGISILAGSYLVAMLVGGSLLDSNADFEDDEYDDDIDCRHCEDVAPYLFIPLAGPFIAMSQTPNDGGLVVLGLVEMVGAALTIGGIVRYQNTKRAAAMSGYSMDLGERRTLTLDVGGTKRTVGPRMTLRF